MADQGLPESLLCTRLAQTLKLELDQALYGDPRKGREGMGGVSNSPLQIRDTGESQAHSNDY